MRRTSMLLLVLSLIFLSACASNHVRPLPESFTQPQGTQSRDYKIQKGDVLDVKFFYNPELNEQVPVRPDGRISLQLAREIRAEGLTPAQLTDVLTSKYSKLIKTPEIAIIVRNFAGQRVFVDGEVNRAGMVTLLDPMTALMAIAQAGGLKETADASKIIVLRRNENNSYTSAKINLTAAVRAKGAGGDIELMPSDIILVPRSGIANVDLWVDQYIRRLVPFPIGVGVGF